MSSFKAFLSIVAVCLLMGAGATVLEEEASAKERLLARYPMAEQGAPLTFPDSTPPGPVTALNEQGVPAVTANFEHMGPAIEVQTEEAPVAVAPPPVAAPAPVAMVPALPPAAYNVLPALRNPSPTRAEPTPPIVAWETPPQGVSPFGEPPRGSEMPVIAEQVPSAAQLYAVPVAPPVANAPVANDAGPVAVTQEPEFARPARREPRPVAKPQPQPSAAVKPKGCSFQEKVMGLCA